MEPKRKSEGSMNFGVRCWENSTWELEEKHREIKVTVDLQECLTETRSHVHRER